MAWPGVAQFEVEHLHGRKRTERRLDHGHRLSRRANDLDGRPYGDTRAIADTFCGPLTGRPSTRPAQRSQRAP